LCVSLASFAAVTPFVASQRVYIVVAYFVIDSVRKLLDTTSFCRINCSFKRTLENKILRDTSVEFCKTVGTHDLTYGSDVWVITYNNRRIDTAEMCFLRSVAGIPQTDYGHKSWITLREQKKIVTQREF